MTNFRRPGPDSDRSPSQLLQDTTDWPAPGRTPFTGMAGRVSRWFQGLDREPDEYDELARDPIAELTAGRPADQRPIEDDDDVAPRFPLAPFGYNRLVVDQALAELEGELDARERELIVREREMDQLRDREEQPVSIKEEIERIGEQTASILVVAHDEAHETTRRAEEQAEQCIADAAANAVQITADAKRRLQELDEETDAVWRERERLLDDAREVSRALAKLVDEAAQRFPADAKAEVGVEAAVGVEAEFKPESE